MTRVPSGASLVHVATIFVLGLVAIYWQPFELSGAGAIGQIKQCSRYPDCCPQLSREAEYVLSGPALGRIGGTLAWRAIILCLGVVVAALAAGTLGVVPRWLSLAVAVVGVLGLLPHLLYFGYVRL